jgi:hypothetical protein
MRTPCIRMSITLDEETVTILDAVSKALHATRSYALRHIIITWHRATTIALEGEQGPHPSQQTPPPPPTAPPALYPLSAPAAPRAADAARPTYRTTHRRPTKATT